MSKGKVSLDALLKDGAKKQEIRDHLEQQKTQINWSTFSHLEVKEWGSHDTRVVHLRGQDGKKLPVCLRFFCTTFPEAQEVVSIFRVVVELEEDKVLEALTKHPLVAMRKNQGIYYETFLHLLVEEWGYVSDTVKGMLRILILRGVIKRDLKVEGSTTVWHLFDRYGRADELDGLGAVEAKAFGPSYMIAYDVAPPDMVMVVEDGWVPFNRKILQKICGGAWERLSAGGGFLEGSLQGVVETADLEVSEELRTLKVYKGVPAEGVCPITIPDVTAKGLLEVLHILLSGRVDGIENLLEVVKTLGYLGQDAAITAVVDYVLVTIDKTNIGTVWTLGWKLNVQKIKDECIKKGRGWDLQELSVEWPEEHANTFLPFAKACGAGKRKAEV